MTHTKGPWNLKAGRSIETPSGEFYLTYGHDTYGNPTFKDFCELDANARLIAAAPALYAALRIARDRLTEYANSQDECWNDWADSYVIDAALAQADGKEQP